MKFSAIQEFAVLFFSPGHIRGCWFKRSRGRLALTKHISAPADAENPAGDWKKIRKELGFGSDCILFLTGNIGNAGVFYRTVVPDLPQKS